MSSYRFCRSDDIPLLVRAHNECYRPHFPALPEMTADDFKREVREIDLWTSSCMVASSGPDPIAVMHATKRETETLIVRIGVRPDQMRRGHGLHLMTSLSAKAAILGPPRMTAEVPRDDAVARAFFEACGYRREREYTDFVLHGAQATADAPQQLVIPTTLDELLANETIDLEAPRCWQRSPATLIKRKARLDGLAVASAERIEAYLLFEETGGERLVQALGGPDGEHRETWWALLLRTCAAHGGPLRFPRVLDSEVSFDWLRAQGFEPAEATVGYAAQPVAG